MVLHDRWSTHFIQQKSQPMSHKKQEIIYLLDDDQVSFVL